MLHVAKESAGGLAADCLHPLIVTFSGTVGYTEFPASSGIDADQLPGRGPRLKAVALPDELAAQIVKERRTNSERVEVLRVFLTAYPTIRFFSTD